MDCFTLSVLLLNWTLPAYVLAPSGFEFLGYSSMGGIACAAGAAFPASANYTAAGGLSAALPLSGATECRAPFVYNGTAGTLVAQIGTWGGHVGVSTELEAGSCLVRSAAVANCSITPSLESTVLEPAGAFSATLAFETGVWLSSLVGAAGTGAGAQLCAGVGAGLTQQLTNHTVAPPAPYPPMTPGLTDLRDSRLIAMLTNIVAALPRLGPVRLAAAVPAGNALRINVTLDAPVDADLLIASFHAPAGTSLALDVVLRDFVCATPFDCALPRRGGVELLNLRVAGAGAINRLIDNLVGGALTELIDQLINNSSATNSSAGSNSSSTMQLALPTKAVDDYPPYFLAVGLAAMFSALAISVIAYSANRHTHHPVVDAKGKPVSLVRIIIEDSVVVIVCFVTMFMFAWSNSTDAASMVVGNEVVIYSFSLGNTVTDLWKAGLVPLSFFVCLFSGVYPYIKLISIVVFSVVLQRPQSRVLRTIDAFGKFSLLDTFVMMIMVTGLEINGIANVHMHPSFWVFLAATVVSIAVGNYATHGWRRETDIDINGKKALESQGSVLFPRQPSEQPSEFDDDDGAEGASAFSRWQWKIALPAAGVMIAAFVLTFTHPCLEYNISGVAQLITGATKQFSLLELLRATAWPLMVSGAFTILVAPLLYLLLYPHAQFLAAWCATDALLLACVAGLVQLEQFISFVLGSELKPVYSASATLMWPLAVLCAGMVLQWLLIGKNLLRVRCCGPQINRSLDPDYVAETTVLYKKDADLESLIVNSGALHHHLRKAADAAL